MTKNTSDSKPTDTRMKVRATADGYYEHCYLRRGDVFTVAGPRHFSTRWMEEVDPETPEKITSSGEALQREREETLASRAQSKLSADIDHPTGADNVLGQDSWGVE
jgi:hypothetical protein